MKKMNQFLKISLLFFLPLFFIACEEETPQTVVTAYTEHWFKGELDAAKRFIVPEQRETVDKLAGLKTAEELKNLKENTIEIVIQDENRVTDSTITMRCRVIINGEPRTNHYHLSKIKDRWYVNIN